MKKVAIVNFSTHHDGNGDCLIDFISANLNHLEVKVIKFSKMTNLNGCGRCGYDCFHKAFDCPFYKDDIVHTYQQIADCDFCYMILPNYSDVPPATYFMFRERSQCVYQNGLWAKYHRVPKHFIVFSNTSKHLFEELLVNEVENQLSIDFLSSKDIELKAVNSCLLDDAYFQNKVLSLLTTDGLI